MCVAIACICSVLLLSPHKVSLCPGGVYFELAQGWLLSAADLFL